MSLSTDQTLNPGSYGGTAGDKVYNQIAPPNLNSSLRRVAATATTAPDRLTISHRQTKKGSIITDDHLIRIDEQFNDPLLGSGDYSSWISLKVPRGTSVVTPAMVKSQIGRVFAAWMAAGQADKILNGEL